MLLHLALGQLEGQQDAATDLRGILDALEAGSILCPCVFSEVGMRGASGQDQIIVGELRAGGEAYATCMDVDGIHRIHEDFSVLLVTQDGANGLCDIGRGKNSKRNLVEQRLKGVVVASIENRYIDGQVPQPTGCVDACKACTHNDHAWPSCVPTGLKRFCKFAHCTSLSAYVMPRGGAQVTDVGM